MIRRASRHLCGKIFIAMAKLSGKIAVVTGGSTGIGLASAKRFVDEGAHVFITGRRQAELDKAAAEIGREVTTVQGDVASLADLDRLYARVKAEKGVIDILFANAGVVEHVPMMAITEDHYDRIMGVNLKGVVFTIQKAVPLMTRGGAIVVNTSIVGIAKSIPSLGIYSASKAGARGLIRSWLPDLSARGIRINALSPGSTDTPIFDAQFASPEIARMARQAAESLTPLKRMGSAEELANAAFFLASDESSYVTGVDLQVDGGMAQV
jgi:NAD(P)-dependent dehydrogenase (short-subunit alcohol dehydrogenase family)